MLLLAAAAAVVVGVVAIGPWADQAVQEVTLPLRHDDIIRQQAADKDLDPALIAGVIYTESRFRQATSSAGAKGLMQIMPDTADFIARTSGGTAFEQGDLASPQVNIAYGSWLLRHLLDHYDGETSSRWPPTTRARATSTTGSPPRAPTARTSPSPRTSRSRRRAPTSSRSCPRATTTAASTRTSSVSDGRGMRRGQAIAGVALVVAGAAAVVALWWTSAEATGAAAGTLAEVARLSGLLGAYLVLVELLLLARLPLLDRLYGFGTLTAWHRWNGRACVSLLVVHALLIVVAYARADDRSLPAELLRLIEEFPGVITAIAGLVLLLAVVVSSAVIVRRRLRYETWYFVHLYAYLAVALAFSHQLASGTAFVGRPLARTFWTALYVATLAAIVGFRIVLPLARSLRHRLRVARVVEEAPGFASIEIAGVGLDRLGARSGQFFGWRFLTRDRWWESHPFSLSAAPEPDRLRITVKGVGDFSGRLGSLRPGTRVIAEGPFGAFTTAARRRPRVALIAGGVGITPVRALLEDMPGAPGEIAVVYRARRAEDVILRAELDALAGRRGAEVHYVRRRRRRALRRAAARAGPRPGGARRLPLRLAGDDAGDPRHPDGGRGPAPPDRHRAVRVLSVSPPSGAGSTAIGSPSSPRKAPARSRTCQPMNHHVPRCSTTRPA